MSKLMKPERLSLDPSNPTASKMWKHWIRTFENYVSSLPRVEEREVDKLQLLTNCVDFSVFDFIEDCETYEAAVQTL